MLSVFTTHFLTLSVLRSGFSPQYSEHSGTVVIIIFGAIVKSGLQVAERTNRIYDPERALAAHLRG